MAVSWRHGPIGTETATAPATTIDTDSTDLPRGWESNCGTTTAIIWIEMDDSRLREAVQRAREFVDEFFDPDAEPEEIHEASVPVPRGPRPELRSDPAPRRERANYRVNRARPPPRTRPSSEGRE